MKQKISILLTFALSVVAQTTITCQDTRAAYAPCCGDESASVSCPLSCLQSFPEVYKLNFTRDLSVESGGSVTGYEIFRGTILLSREAHTVEFVDVRNGGSDMSNPTSDDHYNWQGSLYGDYQNTALILPPNRVQVRINLRTDADLVAYVTGLRDEWNAVTDPLAAAQASGLLINDAAGLIIVGASMSHTVELLKVDGTDLTRMILAFVTSGGFFDDWLVGKWLALPNMGGTTGQAVSIMATRA